MKQIAFILFLNIALTTIAMEKKATVNQPPAQIQQLAADKTITTFLWRYAIAKFCDIDERGVYYNGITADDRDTTFTLPWSRVKTLLDKAYEDLSHHNALVESKELSGDYRKALREIQRNLDPTAYESLPFPPYIQVGESRKKYRAAWASGDITQIKEVLKEDHELWPPHID
jgi:hypothetical protein